MSKVDLFEWAAYASLALTVFRVLWPEFASTARMVWMDLISARRAVGLAAGGNDEQKGN